MTATSVQVSWESINSMYRDIQGYLTSYRPENIYTWSAATCGSSCTSIIVENVQPNVTYRFRVQAFTVKGYGVAGTLVHLNIPPLGKFLNIGGKRPRKMIMILVLSSVFDLVHRQLFD